MNYELRIKALVLVLASCFLLLASEKSSAESISLGVFPPITQIQAKPPASVISPITIENPQDQEISLGIEFRQFRPSPKENGDIEFISTPLPSIFQKMQILDNDHVITQLNLAPQQKKTLNLHIGISDDEKPSDYYFSILFISKEPKDIGSSQSKFIGGIASNVLLSVGPTGPTQGKISQFSVPFFISHGPVPFRVKVLNQSDHYITPTGLITIKNMFGQTIGKVDLLPVNILKNSQRIIPDPKETSFTDPKASWDEKFLLGFYTARVTIGLSEEGPIYNKTVSFLAIPIELIAGLLVSISIVGLIVKRVREKQIEESQTTR